MSPWRLKFRFHVLHIQSWWPILASVLWKAWNTLVLGYLCILFSIEEIFRRLTWKQPMSLQLENFSFPWSGRNVQCLGMGCISQAVSAWLGCLQYIPSARLLLCGHEEAFKVLFLGNSFQKFISSVKCSLHLPSTFLPVSSSKKTEVVARH